MSQETPTAAAQLSRAAALVDLGRYGDAREILLTLVGDGPSAQTWCLLSQCDLQLGHPGRGLQAADHAAALEPESEWAHRLRSANLSAMRHHPMAVDAAQRAVAVAPYLFTGHLALAEAYLSAGFSTRQAVAAAQHAAELAPNDTSALNTLGRARAADGDMDGAEKAYLQALEIDPTNSAVRNNLGVLDLRRHRTSRAMEHFASSAQSDPRASYVRRNTHIAAVQMVEHVGWAVLGVVVVLGFVRQGLYGDGSNLPGATGRVTVCLLLLLTVATYFGWRLRRLGPGARRVVWNRRMWPILTGTACLVGVALVLGFGPWSWEGAMGPLFTSALIVRVVAAMLQRSRLRS